jgi:ubiquinone/menaquinone biosynthesis C-methylase UbiE/uncharacterized protein YbaR (Trm112 family)
LDDLICPLTKRPLRRDGNALIRDDGAAYPIVNGIPVLMGPEILHAAAPDKGGFYAEAYAEAEFYNHQARDTAALVTAGDMTTIHAEGIRFLESIRQLPPPFPDCRWLCARMDLGAQWDCYRHIGDVQGQRVLQLGGTGLVAVSLMLTGAASATLLTPMLCEAELALAMADRCGVKLRCIVAIAEQIPLQDDSIDAAYSGGCVHHMTTELAFPEVARVLAPGGRFAALEPWRAPFYSIGTKVFGKREANPFCRPITRERAAPMFKAFEDAKVVQHGTFTRYPMLALEKLGVLFPLEIARRVGIADDGLASVVGLRRFGSSVALLARKHQAS